MVSILMIIVFCPRALNRFSFTIPKNRRWVTALIFSICALPMFLSLNISGNSFATIIEGLVFSLFIGIDEELFDRGFIFGKIETKSIWIAAWFSSLQFGAIHFLNFAYGYQSLSYTAGQMIDAASFGLLCTGLLVYSQSIFVPVLLHGIADWPMQLQTGQVFHNLVTGSPDWLGIIVDSSLNCALGVSLIALCQPKIVGHIETLLKSKKLITP